MGKEVPLASSAKICSGPILAVTRWLSPSERDEAPWLAFLTLKKYVP